MGKGGEAKQNATPAVIKEAKESKTAGEPGLENFWWDDEVNVHVKRARAIAKKYKISKIFGPCKQTKYKVLLGVGIQLISLELLRGAPLWMWLICCYMLSGAVNGCMTLAMHELTHDLGSKRHMVNRWLGLLANAPMGLPAYATFKRYHIEHHKYMGEDELDVDIPTWVEGYFFQGLWAKVVWLFFQPAWYSLRPLVVAPKTMKGLELLNHTWIISIDLLVYSRYGIMGVLYLVLGTIFGMQFHPVAGHFVAEHFILADDQETYSYYGPLNWITFNVGYHNEHHDFAFIAGTKLPELRAMAPEFYDEIPHYHSWTKVLVDFIMDPHLTPFSRMKREVTTVEERQALKARGGLDTK